MALTSRQRKAAEMMVAEPEKHLKDIAHELGVDEATFWRWRKRDDFKEYVHELCHERFMDLEKICIAKLRTNAIKGNQRAIEYALNYIGYQPAQKVEANVNTDIVIDVTED